MILTKELKPYAVDKIKLQHNNKTEEVGTIDVIKGCLGCEMKKAPCYASKGAIRKGINFFQPIQRKFDEKLLRNQIKKYKIDWIRMGCISDPSLDWFLTGKVAELIRNEGKIPVIITKVYKLPKTDEIQLLIKAKAYIQISVCGITPNKDIIKRSDFALKLSNYDEEIRSSWRINSGVWKKNSRAERIQDELILFGQERKIRIIDTPLRIFKISPLWKLVDQTRYFRHRSPISGKLDNQYTAGLIIEEAYPCFSTCADSPKNNDPIGCSHQCITRI